MFAYYIWEAGLVDREFIEKRCENWAEFENGLRSLDLDELEKIHGVDRELVKAAALEYANAENAMAFHGLGVTEHSHGSKTVMPIADIAMMTGNIGRRGVGVNPLRGQNNVQGAADMGCQPHQGAGYLPVNDPANHALYEQFYGGPMSDQIGWKIPQMYDAALAGKLKALWVMGEDLVQTDPNTEHVKEALNALEFLVVQELFMTRDREVRERRFARRSFLEKSGTFTNGERRVQRVQCRHPAARRHEDRRPDHRATSCSAWASRSPTTRPTACSRRSPASCRFSKARHGKTSATRASSGPSRKAASAPKSCTSTLSSAASASSTSSRSRSRRKSTHHGEFPFILTTGRVLEHYNCGTMTRRTGNAQIVTEDLLAIHPEDAARKGIADGDIVRVFSARGEVRMKARISDEVKPGILYTTFHFPENLVNVVTSSECDEDTMCPEYKVVAVDVEKVPAAPSAPAMPGSSKSPLAATSA